MAGIPKVIHQSSQETRLHCAYYRWYYCNDSSTLDLVLATDY